MRSFIGLLALVCASTAWAVPAQLRQQGIVSDAAGPLQGTHTVRFLIYDDDDGGSLVWSETRSVTFVDGVYGTTLGSDTVNNPLDDSILDRPALWVTIEIGGAELGPRQRLVSVPYALRAVSADNVTGGEVDASMLSINGVPVIDSSGTFLGQLSWVTLGDLPCGRDQVPVSTGSTWVCGTVSGGAGGSVSWNDLEDVPADLLDGDADGTASAVGCQEGHVLYWNAGFNRWGCRAEQDVVAKLQGAFSIGDVTARSLTVTGGTKLGTVNTCATSNEGTLRYVTGTDTVQVCTGTAWKALTSLTLAELATSSVQVGSLAATGGVQIGTTSTCGIFQAGTLRYDQASRVVELCDGAAWEPLSTFQLGDLAGADVTAADGTFDAVTIGGNTSTDTLDVSGDAVLGSATIVGGLQLGTQTACGTSDAGTLRYAGGVVQYCDGAAWKNSGARDTTPAAVTFPAVSSALLNGTTTSSIVTLTGFDGTLTAAALGHGRPLLRVNGGAWVPAATVVSGDTVQLALTVANDPGVPYLASLVVGDTATTWTVTGGQPEETCLEWRTTMQANGTYTIDPDGVGGNAPFQVYCDMTGGGWTWAALGQKFRVPYTGIVTEIKTPSVSTEYDLVLAGAAGGKGTAYSPGTTKRSGYGGLAAGKRVFAAGTVLYAYVGGQGMAASMEDRAGCRQNRGGWNGGGTGTQGGAGGGGATDIRTAREDLWARLIVAGGGGGCGNGSCTHYGGHGGGTTAETSESGYAGGGQTYHGSNTSHYGSFGRGGDANTSDCNDAGGAGGGWWGGNAAGSANYSAGGGSSFIDPSFTAPVHTTGQNQGDGYIEYIFK